MSSEGTAGTPSFTPAAGTYSSAQSVTLSSSTQGAAIFYTTDGTTPTSASTRYTSAIAVSSSETIEAIAEASGVQNSTVASAAYSIQLSPTLSATSYTFPANTVGNALIETVATVTNPNPAALTLNASIAGDPSMTLVSSQSCGTTLAANASCNLVAQYLPIAAGTQTATVTLAYSGAATGSSTVALSGTANTPATGTAASTSNPLVALFSVTPGFSANVSVQFGLTTSYGYDTAQYSTPTGNDAGQVQVEVAGMRANMTYHMRAAITYTGGDTVYTPDTTFTTGALPAQLANLPIQATTAAGMTPQPGIELLNPIELQEGQGTQLPFATDLQGNIIWYYPWPDNQNSTNYFIAPIKQLPNSDYLMSIGANPAKAANTPFNAGLSYIREIDLIGNTVKQLSLQTLNTELAAAGYVAADGTGNPLVLYTFHHDVTPLPNGHWLVLTNTLETINGVQVVGDVVVDVNQSMQPVWVWNEFAHLNAANTSTLSYPDWTHSNAIVYTPTDGNILVSMRDLNLVVKVDYNNGMGNGSILWKLGSPPNGGTFSLVDTVDPLGDSQYDWQFAQHAPAIVGDTSAGTFQLTMMDNGDDRYIETGGDCPAGSTSECYSTVPIFQIDEDAQTATMVSRVTVPVSMYNDFGGNAEVLANGDLEYDLCGAPAGGTIIEAQQNSTQTQVWTWMTPGLPEYRGFRMPSLYSGVQWP